MPFSKHLRVAAPILTIALSINALFVFNNVRAADSFFDLPSNPLYRSAIELFQEQNIIIGKTMGGQPTGQLSPTDHLNRAEFTKVATLVRLLEEKQNEGELSKYLNIDLNDFTLKTNSLLQPYYTSRPGAPKFSDVAEKDINCAQEPGGCEPWFTQYVNYMASLGVVQGTGGAKFSPEGALLRIHALKMIMVNNGKVPANQDSRFLRLSNDERIKNRTTRCLAGAEDYILAANGGSDKLTAQNLLAYSLLADKLDVFGNECQAFADKGISLYDKQAVANYLQQPLTRQEIARYFALTTTIPELQLNPATDPTVDTKYEYRIPVDTEVKKEKDPLARLREEGKLGAENKTNPSLPNNPGLSEEAEETNTPLFPPASPEVTIEGCYSFKADRGDKEDQIKGCIASLKRAGISEEEIKRRLKEAGLWDMVKNERVGDNELAKFDGCAQLSPTSPNSRVAILKCVQSLFDGRLSDAEIKKLLRETGLWERLKDYVVDESSLRKLEANLDDYYEGYDGKGHTAEETLLWGLNGKRAGSDKYNRVLYWYSQKLSISFFEAKNRLEKLLKNRGTKEAVNNKKEKEEENQIRRSIEGEYIAVGEEKIMMFEPNMDNGPNPWRIRDNDKTLSFWIKNGGGMSEDNDYRSNGNDTYILIHGRQGNPNDWATGMANSIHANNWRTQILLLDWHEIANQFDTYLKFIDIPKAPGKISKWTIPIVDSIDVPLVDWNIGSNTTLIGHSLGSFIAGKLAKNLNKKGIGMPNLIALEPTAYPFDLKLDFDDAETMQGFNGNGTCFVADASLSGSEKLMKTCREGYLIDYSGDPRSRLINELHDYVDYVIDEAVAKSIEYVVDEGITYAVEQTINKNLGVRIRGVRMYKIAGGKLQEVFLENLQSVACKRIDSVVYLPYICEYGVKELKDRFVTYHNDVYKTYGTILQYPFYDSLLSPSNLASHRGRNVSFDKMSKGQNGTIITEYDQPEKIKYLKVENPYSDGYTLYGNTEANQFECAVSNDCEAYGGGGADSFNYFIQPNTLTIKDFKENENDGDKIYFLGGQTNIDAKLTRPNTITITITYESESLRDKTTHFVNVLLDGTKWSLGKVEEWVKIAKADKKYTDPITKIEYTGDKLEKLKIYNPIQIQ